MRTSLTIGSLRAIADLDPHFDEWELVDLAGWYGRPSILHDAEPIPGQHGFLPPTEVTYAGRYVYVTLRKRVQPHQDIRSHHWGEFSDIRIGVPYSMTVEDAAGALTTDVWLTEAPDFVIDTVEWWATVTLPLMAPDPRKYGPARPLRISATPETTNGLEFPLFEDGFLSFGPFDTGAGFGAGSFALHNHGSIESYPIYRVTGAIAGGFSILTDGGELKFAQTVPPGTELVLSPYAGGRAVLNGVDVTVSLTVADWVPVARGERRGFTFVPVGTASAGAELAVDFREAWI
ncbi:phage tail family protein [Agromyces atrinae]|uniref:phage tail family protein n=1 Tax=Agromyces atrinae TaxID=592376 RepID=UPI001F580147|nr:phage tail family protein [Agromyces atrinae]MCI2959554.1 phage tail family protein [Agromyces atrinae]